MARRSSGLGGGGLFGSGIFGFFGTTINCDSKDDSTYCNIMKISRLIVFITLAVLLQGISLSVSSMK